MSSRRGSGVRERIRSRRGAISVVLIAALLGGVAFLPEAARLGGLPLSDEVGHPHLLSAGVAVNVSMSDTAPGFTLAPNVVTANVTLHVHLVNQGLSTHSFSLFNETNAAIAPATNNTPAKLNETWGNQTHPGPNIWLPAGSQTNFTLNFSVPGSYEVISLVPYQFQGGLSAFLHVLPHGSATEQSLWVNGTAATVWLPATMYASPGIPIVINAGIQGSLSHTFVLDGVSNDSAVSPGTNLPSSFSYPAPPTSAQFPISLNLVNAGTTYTSSPVILKAGVYWYVCTVPGHFASGMWGKLYVGVQPTPPASVPQISNVIQYAYLGLAAVIIGGAAFLILMGQMERPVAAAPSKPHEP